MSSENYRELSSKSFNRKSINCKNELMDFIGASMGSKDSSPRSSPEAINLI